MEQLDRKAIRALASDTRVAILKSLGERRKMPSELAREQNLADSTVVEHLKQMEAAGLVRKVETGHKWIYYELSDKGRNLAAPKWPMQFVVMLSLGVLLVFSSMSFSYVGIGELGAIGPATAPAFNQVPVPEKTMGVAVDTAQQNVSGAMGAPGNITQQNPPPQKLPDLVSPATIIFILGAMVIAISSWRMLRSD